MKLNLRVTVKRGQTNGDIGALGPLRQRTYEWARGVTAAAISMESWRLSTVKDI